MSSNYESGKDDIHKTTRRVFCFIIPYSVGGCMSKVQRGLFSNQTIQCLDLILNHVPALGGVLLLKRSQTAQSLCGSWRWQGRKWSQIFKRLLKIMILVLILHLHYGMSNGRSWWSSFLPNCLGFIHVINFDKVPGNAHNICSAYVHVFP